MATSDVSLQKKVDIAASFIGDNFLRVAKALRKLQDDDPEIFLKVAESLGISRRKAYALARIDRQFTELGVEENRLYVIGWSKLQIVGRYLIGENAEYLLQLAEQNTSHDLEILLRGETPVEDAKVVQLYLAAEDYKRLRATLKKYGAVVSGNGLAKTEIALMALIDKVEPGA
ncbi:hypothetical protein [Mesorhizobium sp. GR13]|uniref:hypothetical protein n=1 Tax=Mesorhizobium sp. GR13 TaxID=2562308 RepID=UPI0010BF8697|nr:hypothetical protein [Mesorhizobium sp. GR13]